jgi:hypothetical protein
MREQETGRRRSQCGSWYLDCAIISEVYCQTLWHNSGELAELAEEMGDQTNQRLTPLPVAVYVSLFTSTGSCMKRWPPLIGGVLLHLALGAFYAWSVFVLPLSWLRVLGTAERS